MTLAALALGFMITALVHFSGIWGGSFRKSEIFHEIAN
jgi:hypothetical protein